MTTPDQQIRLLDLTFDHGARQLAISEAIINAVGDGVAPPTLRLYSWSEPVVILGVGQPVSEIDLETCRIRGYRILRRIGGGTAVYHDADEVSVDLIVPSGSELGPTDVHAGYRQFSERLSIALSQIGIAVDTVSIEQARSMDHDVSMRPICFASISPYEFFHQGRKLDGICQIRRRDAIAYQAAIYNRFPVEPMIASVRHENPELRGRRSERLTEFSTDLTTAHGSSVDYHQLQCAVASAFSRLPGIDVVAGELTDVERQETERLIAEKYGNDEWTYRR